MAKKNGKHVVPAGAGTFIRRLTGAWKRFGFEQKFAKGASAASLARVERLGSVPQDLLDFLAWHDGSRGREVDGYYRLLSCAEIVRQKKLMDDMVPEFEDGWMPGEWWNVNWIPFLEFNGDLVCLDGKRNVVGFEAYDTKRPILYRSFVHWLTTIAELWADVPDSASEEERRDFFASPHATRIKRRLNPGYPIARTAKRRPAVKAPKGLESVCEWFMRGPYEWRIEQAGATVRTYFGRGISRRYHVKTFRSVDKARAHVKGQIRLKLREGYACQKSEPCSDNEFLAAAGRHLATLTRAAAER